jgi:aminomethyltransferase
MINGVIMQNLLKTPLYQEHQKLNAQIAPFGHWSMPIQYSGILSEHKACRESAALFDICHMGEFYFKGDIAGSGIEKVFTISVSGIPLRKCKYALMLNENGGIIDDSILYRLSEDELMIVVNSETINKDFNIIKYNLSRKAEFKNISEATAKLDLQGPLSRDVLAEHFGQKMNEIPYFGFIETEFFHTKALISRTGYTGELGYEIYLDNWKVIDLWRDLLSDSRVKPAGLGARDILRLEMGYSLYGNDIDENTTPVEAGLEFAVNYNKDFTGKPVLLKQKENGTEKVKIAFRADSRRSPRQHYQIMSGGRTAGEVTSGAFSPGLSSGIGLGYVMPEYAKPGSAITLNHDAIEIEAKITELPFLKNGSLKK